MVTLTPLTPVGVNLDPQPVVHVPTIVAPNNPKRGHRGSLNSLEMEEANMSREFQVSPKALEAQRLEKLVRNLRRQASVTCEEDARWVSVMSKLGRNIEY